MYIRRSAADGCQPGGEIERAQLHRLAVVRALQIGQLRVRVDSGGVFGNGQRRCVRQMPLRQLRSLLQSNRRGQLRGEGGDIQRGGDRRGYQCH